MGRCVAKPDKVDGSLSFNFECGVRLGGAHGETNSLWLWVRAEIYVPFDVMTRAFEEKIKMETE